MNLKTLQRTLIVVVVALMVLGALLVFSASGSYSQLKNDSFYALFRSHIIKVVIACILMFTAWLTPYDYYKKYSKHAIIASLFLLVLTFITAPKVNGSARWIDIGIMKFQPSEFAKLVLIIHLAKLIEKKGLLMQDFNAGYKYVAVWIFTVAFLIFIQPNVSMGFIALFVGFAMIFASGAKLKHIFASFSIAGLAGVAGMMLFEHSRTRVLSFFTQNVALDAHRIQALQAKIALGSGGFLGLGIGQSRQSAGFLPESYSDFIFSILGEEFGFIGAILLLLAFLIIFIIGIIIAKKANDQFSQLLALGISFNILISALINAAVVSGLLPTTGITLPFISFGGTSIILSAVSVGILLNISRSILKAREMKQSNNINLGNHNRKKTTATAI